VAEVNGRPPGGLTCGQAVRQGERLLAAAGIGAARLEAEVLLAFCLCTDRTGVLQNLHRPLLPRQTAGYLHYLGRRAGGEPLQYLTGCQEFMSLPLLVTPQVLIPRGDTEVLVEAVLELARRDPRPWRVVDVGTGSGAIALSLARYLPDGSEVYATDISPAALAVARENAGRLGLTVRFLAGDLLRPLLDSPGLLGDGFDAVISNPPYIPTGLLAGLPADVRHEPRLALDGGEDGLAVYRPLIDQAAGVLKRGGLLAVEIGWDQALGVTGLLGEQGGFTGIQVRPDLAGRDRIVLAWRGEGHGE